MRRSADRFRSGLLRLSIAAGLLAVLLPRQAAAQRSSSVYGTAAPIYQDNFDAFFESLPRALQRLEEAGWLLRGGLTTVVQASPGFRSPYSGPNSFSSRRAVSDTEEIDLVLGRRLWSGAEFILVPSAVRGYGLSNTLGIGNYPNGLAANRSSVSAAYLSHAFLRQTFDLSYDALGQDSDPTRFAGPLAAERITLTMGRVSVFDFFDTNRYAVDATTQFLNWGLFASAGFPAAADTRGGTNGLVVEWENPRWATRFGVFQVARDVAAQSLDPQFLKHWQALAELDRFWFLGQLPGAARLLAGMTRLRTRHWDDLTSAVLAGAPAPESHSAWQPTAALSAEQALNDEIGLFLRAGWSDGRVQNWMFTETDWSVATGLSINGMRWGRTEDTVGAAVTLGGLSRPHRRYLSTGGLGSVLGDGRLNYAAEKALEFYYTAQLAPGAAISLDYQLVSSPGFNADRGPASIFTLRTRLSF